MSNSFPEWAREWPRTMRLLGLHLARSLFFPFWNFLLCRGLEFKSPATREKKLLIVRTDRIGDYLLFRNFLRAVRQSAAYRDWKITFCGNRAYKELAEYYDRNWVNDFIWVDRRRFFQSSLYHFHLLKDISSCGFSVAFQPAFSPDLCADLLVLASQAPVRVGVDGDAAAQSRAQLAASRAFYTRLLSVEQQAKFEFLRNREIIEKFIGEPAPIDKPSLPPPERSAVEDAPYAVLAAGAASRFKQWLFFGEVAEHLKRRYNMKVYLTGLGGKECRRVRRSLTRSQRRMIVDLCGRTTLLELAALLAGAALVAANDTGAMHMAVMLNRPTVCISGGTNAFRFNCYPERFDFNLSVLFPPEVEAMTREELANRFVEYSQNYNLAKISVDRVCAAIDELLTKSGG